MSVTSRNREEGGYCANTIPIAVAEYVRGNGWKRQMTPSIKPFFRKRYEKWQRRSRDPIWGWQRMKRIAQTKLLYSMRALKQRSKIGGLILYSSMPHPSQRILESTPQSLEKIKPGKRCLGNTFLTIRVRMLWVSPPALGPDSPLMCSSLPAVQSSIATAMRN